MPSSTFKLFIAAIVLICILAVGWMIYRTSGAALNWQMGKVDPVLQFYPYNGSIYALCITNLTHVGPGGNVDWSVPFPNIVFSSLGADGSLYAYSTDRGLNRITPEGGIISLTRQGINRPPLLGTDGMVYLRSWSLLLAINA